jgi:hypothetical protein
MLTADGSGAGDVDDGVTEPSALVAARAASECGVGDVHEHPGSSRILTPEERAVVPWGSVDVSEPLTR